MNKTLMTAALACVLSIGGLALSAADYTEKDKVEFNSMNTMFSSRVSDSLKVVFLDTVEKNASEKSLSEKLSSYITSTRSDGTVFGYKVDNNSIAVFVPLAGSEASVSTVDKLDVATIHLGKFDEGQSFQFGFANADGSNFEPIPVQSVKDIKASGAGNSSITVAGDPLYYAGYSADSFYQLDFSEDPFNGNIEILVMGEPLPTSTVTLLVALGLASAFLLYNNRRQRVRAEQA